MFKQNNKGGVSLAILITSIVIAVLVFGATIGIIIWKVVGTEDISKDRESSKSKQEQEEEKKEEKENEKKGPTGLVNCGISRSFLSEFNEFDEIDFESDSALVCMGNNIRNNCKESEAIVKIVDGDLFYKISGSSVSNCRARLEVYNRLEQRDLFVECPISELISIARSEVPDPETWISGSPGAYGALVLIMTNYVGDDASLSSSIGCTSNVYE